MTTEPYGYRGRTRLQTVHRPCVADAGKLPRRLFRSEPNTQLRSAHYAKDPQRRRPRAIAARAYTRRRPPLALTRFDRDQAHSYSTSAPTNDPVVKRFFRQRESSHARNGLAGQGRTAFATLRGVWFASPPHKEARL